MDGVTMGLGLAAAAALAGGAMTWRARRGAALVLAHVGLAAGAILFLSGPAQHLGALALLGFLCFGIGGAIGVMMLGSPGAPARPLLWAHGGAALAGTLLFLAAWA